MTFTFQLRRFHGWSGGYELLKANQSCMLEMIPSPSEGYTVSYLKDVVGQGRIYIRPIQKDLSLTPVVLSVRVRMFIVHVLAKLLYSKSNPSHIVQFSLECCPQRQPYQEVCLSSLWVSMSKPHLSYPECRDATVALPAKAISVGVAGPFSGAVNIHSCTLNCPHLCFFLYCNRLGLKKCASTARRKCFKQR